MKIVILGHKSNSKELLLDKMGLQFIPSCEGLVAVGALESFLRMERPDMLPDEGVFRKFLKEELDCFLENIRTALVFCKP